MRTLFILLAAFTLSCQGMKENEIKELKEEVLRVHDEVMPKMSELTFTRRNLETMADSLQSTDSVKAASMREAAADIRAANMGMRDWMQNFEPEPEGTHEEIIQYFEDQKVSIKKVKEDMEGSLEKGTRILESTN